MAAQQPLENLSEDRYQFLYLRHLYFHVEFWFVNF